jgi:beta-phosphoglucomutase-like phosphatase (HAD superfamily)
MGVDPARLLVIEDSGGGVESGKRAGGLVLAMGTTNPEEVFHNLKPEFRPDMFAASFNDIELIA